MTSVGSDDPRRETRAKAQARTKRRAIAAFALIASGDRSSVAVRSVASHAKWIDDVRRMIVARSDQPSFKYALYRILAEHSGEIIARHGLECAAFRPPVRFTRTPDRRSLHSLTPLFRQREVERRFFEQCKRYNERDPHTPMSWLRLIAWSAATRAFLLEADLLCALLETVQKEACPLIRSQRYGFAIELIVDVKNTGRNQTFNSIDDGQLRRHQFCYPDPLTLALIYRFRRAVESDCGVRIDPVQLLDRGPDSFGLGSLQQLVQSAIWWSDDQTDLDVAEGMLTAFAGRTVSIGLDDKATAMIEGAQPAHACDHQGIDAELAFSDPAPAFQYPQSSTAVASILRQSTGRHAIQRELTDFAQTANTISAEVALAAWFALLLTHNKVSTCRTYHSRIGKRLLRKFGETDLLTVDSDSFEETYLEFRDSISEPVNAGLVTGTLAQFHRFLVKTYSVQSLSIDITQPLAPRIVRARVLTRVSLDLLHDGLRAAYPEPIYRACWFACILAYRGGLRVSEIAGLTAEDFEQSSDLWVFIHEKGKRQVKTPTSRRKVPLGWLLSEQPRFGERAFVDPQLQSARRNPNTDVVTLLAGRDVDAKSLGRLINAVMRVVYGPGWTVHCLRHAAANNLLFAACDEKRLCADIAGWDEEETAQALYAIVAHPSRIQSRFLGLSMLMGHATPQEVWRSYIHTLPLIIREKTGRTTMGYDGSLAAALLSMGRRGPGMRMQRHAAVDTIAKALSGISRVEWIPGTVKQQSHSDDRTDAESLAQSIIERLKPAIDLVQAGVPVSEAAERHSISGRKLEALVSWARDLSAIATTKGRPRLITQRAGSEFPAFFPILGAGIAHENEAKMQLSRFLTAAFDDQSAPDVHWLFEHCLRHVDLQNPGIPFRRPQDLARAIATLKDAGFPSKDLIVELRLAQVEAVTIWKSAITGVDFVMGVGLPKLNFGGRARGHGRLIIKAPRKHQSGGASARRYFGSYVWRFVLFVVALLEPWREGEQRLSALLNKGASGQLTFDNEWKD